MKKEKGNKTKLKKKEIQKKKSPKNNRINVYLDKKGKPTI